MPFDPMVLLDKYGIPTAVLGYFIWKDYKFTGRIGALMAKIEEYLDPEADPEPAKEPEEKNP